MANWPSVDPYGLDEANPEDLMNMATGFTVRARLDVQGVHGGGRARGWPGQAVDAVQLGADDHRVRSHDRGGPPARGPVTLSVSDILAQSSNVGAVTIGLKLNEERGDDAFDTWIRRFGFGEPTGIDFPGEEQGIVPQPEDYSGSTMGNMPIGQGLAVTPIQMAAAYAAIANRGIVREPRLILEEDGVPVETDPGERVISETNAARLSEMLEGVLEPGGCRNRQGPGLRPGGQDGHGPEGRGRDLFRDGVRRLVHRLRPGRGSSAVGLGGGRQPAIRSLHSGGTVAAPAFGEIAKFALQHLGVPPDTPPVTP